MTKLTTHFKPLLTLVKALGEEPLFKVGDRVKVSIRYPVGHYRVPRYVRGKQAVVDSVIEPAAVDNEEEGFGRNAGSRRHYFRTQLPPSTRTPTQ